mgnify:CR=1 FL=1
MFITSDEIKTLTTFEEVAALPADEIDRYIMRADSWIRRATGRTFPDDPDEITRDDIRIATILLVEYLWYWDRPDNREAVMGPYDGERLGSYSVGFKDLAVGERANPGEETGIKELDNILNFYRRPPRLGNIFRVSGPGDLR